MNKHFSNILINNMSEILIDLKTYLNKVNKLSLDQDAIQEGWRLSELVLREPNQIIWTPWMKNILEKFDGQIPTDPSAKTSKAEEWIESQTRAILEKFCATDNKENYKPQISDPDTHWDYYCTDCWRNFKQGDELRHIKPKMNEDRKEAFEKFMSPNSNFGRISKNIPQTVINSLEVLDRLIPQVTPTIDMKPRYTPFEAKSSNVGYPYFKNDKAKKDGLTYAEITLRDAHRTKLADAMMYPFTALTRNMRRKARPILGSSRIYNYLLDRLTGPEITAYQEKCPLFYAYRDVSEIKKVMIEMVDMAKDMRKKQIPVYLYNRDFSQYDTTIKPEFKLWMCAFNMSKIVGNAKLISLGREICKARTISTVKTNMVYGYAPSNKPLVPIYGRILSGEKVTNTDGGKVNAMLTLTGMQLCSDKQVFEELSRLSKIRKPIMQVCGDDNLSFTTDNIQKQLPDILEKNFGLKVHNDKGEYGAFYLQRRLVRLPAIGQRKQPGELALLTPFTRVIRSLVTRENPTGIGPGGWILMAWSLLYQLIEYPDLLKEVAKIFIPFDKYELGRKLTIKQLIEMVKTEDAKVSSGRKMTTAEKLNDGDPIKQQMYKEIFEGKESEYLRRIWDILKEI